MKKRIIVFVLFIFSVFFVSSQEVLKSAEEDYYDFLSLEGFTERPSLIYRTLSDSDWEIKDNETHIWNEKNLGTTFTLWQPKNPGDNFFAKGLKQGLFLRLYGPEWYNSYNTAAPYGQNDGALWQGKGYNTSFSTGLRLEGYGFELTFKPQISFSQNLAFEIMASSYDSEYGYFWGYGKNKGADAPQRFGNKAFYTFDWGDSEVRYSWHNFTVGFGNQSIWLGPAQINPMLHSNNAATYTKFDIGLRRTQIVLPWLKWYLGDIESRLWVGKLTESEYFDNNEANNHNQYNGFSISYAPSFLDGLILGFNKICLNKWDNKFWQYVNPFYVGNTLGSIGEDTKASVSADWTFEKSALNIYAELGLDDFLSQGLKLYEYARYPFHTLTYTVGLKKAVEISESKGLSGLISFEWNNTEMSQDFQMWHPYNFGFHHQITQGYTNKGQWIGSGLGYGGNSQFLSFTLYSKHGYDKLFIGRNNPDNSYLYSKCVDGTSSKELQYKWYTAYKANFFVGVEDLWFITKDFSIKSSFTYNMIINPGYNPGLSANGANREYNYWHNFCFGLSLKYQI